MSVQRDDASIDVDLELTPSFELAERDDPTPLPAPYVESDDLSLQPERWDRTSNIRQRMAPLSIVKLGVAAIVVSGLSAMAAITLRDDRAPVRRSASLVIEQRPASAQQVITVEPIEAPTVTPIEAPPVTPAITTPPLAVSARHKPAAAAGEGTLMVSTKPPCEIAIDGVATMLTTPQRAIKLRTGKHKVTLFNSSHSIDATFEVVVDARKPTKLIRDFMPPQPAL